MKRNIKRLVSLGLTCMMVMGMVACGSQEGTKESEKDVAVVDGEGTEESVSDSAEEITLTFQTYSKTDQDYFDSIGLTELYKKVKPNVTIELINSKDDVQMAEDIKIKAAAGELPDIMDLKKEWMLSFKEELVPLNDLDCVANSPAGETNMVDGNVLAIRNMYFSEFVYYKKSIFKEYGISVPQTWDEFISVAQTIKEKGEYTPILTGAKDAWVLYPYNEFMPHLVAGSGNYWNEMAEDETPFDEGKPFYEAYTMIDQLYKANVFETDPLGIGWDQASTMFGTEGAMVVSGQWYLSNLKELLDGDLSDVGVFFLPTRTDASQPLNYLVEGTEGGLAVSKSSEHVEEAKAFIEWMNSKEILAGWAEGTSNFCVFDEYDVSLDPVFDEAFATDNLNKLSLNNGDEKFVAIRDALQFDVKGIGQRMLAGEDYKGILSDLNAKWADAKSAAEK